MTTKQDTESQLWERYFEDKSTENRNSLLLFYKDTIDKIAGKLAKEAGDGFSVSLGYDDGDIKQLAYQATMDMIGSYTPGNSKFKTFLGRFLKYRIYDYIRTSSPTKRNNYTRHRKLENLLEEMRQQEGREVQVEELQEYMELDDEGFMRFVRLSQTVFQTSLDNTISDRDGEFGYSRAPKWKDITPDESACPAEEVASRESIEKLFKCLPARERVIMKLYFIAGLSMRETGKSIGITESRVSQQIALCKEIITAYHTADLLM
jgi:RNA polymerase sigma factor for flagellar operon FliA